MERATYLALPYTLPPQLYHHLLQYVTERYNIHLQVDGDSDSPREKITDTKATYNVDIKAAFGTVGIFPVPKHIKQPTYLNEVNLESLLAMHTPSTVFAQSIFHLVNQFVIEPSSRLLPVMTLYRKLYLNS